MRGECRAGSRGEHNKRSGADALTCRGGSCSLIDERIASVSRRHGCESR